MTRGVRRRATAGRPAAGGFAAGLISREQPLVRRHRLPLVNRVIGQPFGSALDRFNRKLMEKAEYLRGDAVGDLQQAPHRPRGKHRWIAQWEVADDGQDEVLEL